MQARRRNAGWTLLEALIAAVIFSALLAIGIPRLPALQAPYAVDGAVRQIAADVQLARQRAIARNARYRIAFTSTTYQLQRETTPNTFVADGGLKELPHAATIGSVSPADPIFDTRGILAGNVTVPVSATGAHTRTVTINVLGRTTIQ